VIGWDMEGTKRGDRGVGGNSSRSQGSVVGEACLGTANAENKYVD